jgi:TP901 family phage tail tape measure protein
MATTYTRRINLYVNGKEVRNDIKSISGEFVRSRNELAKMTIGSKEYEAQMRKVRNLKSIMDEHNSQLRNTQTLWQKTKSIFSKFAPVAGIAGLTAGFVKLVGKMKTAIDAADSFQERVDNLSALTGLVGQPLKDLAKTAKKTSVKIVEGNVRIKQSADDIVDAYTKVGSQRPELLKNGKALASVTEDAIILSEAAKSDLEPAVKGLTTTMNQFNLGAEHSRRIVNAMAAGSKEGAADIPYLTEAIEKSGTTLSMMNVSIEENIGLIEAIAPNYAKASVAGNSLDKVFLKLKEKQIGYVNGTFSVNAALEELEQHYKNGESAASIFGVEHSKMGELLVQNKEEFKRYTQAVTGTNVAIEQAAKNTNNAKTEQQQARNEYKLTAIALGERLSPAMREFYKLAGSAASVLTRLISVKASDQLREDRIEMNNLFTAIKHTKEGTVERKKAIDQLNTTYGNYLPNLLTEHSTLIDIEKAQRAANGELIRNMQIKLREEDLEGLARKQKKIMDNILSDVKKRKGESLMGPAETEIFSLLDQMANMGSLDEAKNKLGAFAKVYRDASKNIGTYSENLQQFFDLFKIRQEQQALLNSINKITTTPGEDTPPKGTRKTVGNIIYEWDGKQWNEIKKLTGGTDPASETPDMVTALGINLEADTIIYDADALAHAEMLAAKKAGEEDWTNFFKKQIEDRENALAHELQIESEIEQARQDLKEMRIDAIGQIAGTLAGMVEQGSAAYIALFALEKALAIASIWVNLAKERSNIAVAAAKLDAIVPGSGRAYEAVMTKKALTQAGINTGIIIAQAISQASGSKKMQGYETGGYTGTGNKQEPAGIVHRGEYVIPSEGVKNPALRPIIDMFENYRVNNSLNRVNFSAIQQAIPKRGFFEGGYTSRAPVFNSKNVTSGFTPPPATDPELKQLIRENTQATREFMKWKPTVYTELIKKDLETLDDIERRRRL